MIDRIPHCPRSSYPDFNNKKFDYSRGSNIDTYHKAANRLGVYVGKFGPAKISALQVEHLLDNIFEAKSIHEMTVYADCLWDAYNSYDALLNAIIERFEYLDRISKEKLALLIKYLRLHTGLNRRPIEGKHLNEINKDAAFYQELAAKVKELIKD